jgi:hypothetical protein
MYSKACTGQTLSSHQQHSVGTMCAPSHLTCCSSATQAYAAGASCMLRIWHWIIMQQCCSRHGNHNAAVAVARQLDWLRAQIKYEE